MRFFFNVSDFQKVSRSLSHLNSKKMKWKERKILVFKNKVVLLVALYVYFDFVFNGNTAFKSMYKPHSILHHPRNILALKCSFSNFLHIQTLWSHISKYIFSLFQPLHHHFSVSFFLHYFPNKVKREVT